jgi:hypothetical protein
METPDNGRMPSRRTSLGGSAVASLAAEDIVVKPHSGKLAASLIAKRNHSETPCFFYTHAKLARYLVSFTGDAKGGGGPEPMPEKQLESDCQTTAGRVRLRPFYQEQRETYSTYFARES